MPGHGDPTDPGPESDSDRLRRAVGVVVGLVPPGHVVSYGDIAELIGIGPRQVGAIMAAGPAPGTPSARGGGSPTPRASCPPT